VLIQALPVEEKPLKVNNQAAFDEMRAKLNNAEAESKDIYSDLKLQLDEKNFIQVANATNSTAAQKTEADPKDFILDEEPIDDSVGYVQSEHMHFCGREGGSCACDGTVHYGKVDPLGWRDCEADPAACADNLLSHPHVSKLNQNADSPTGCNNLELTDPAPGFAKLCFCEPPREEPIHRCGLQGEDCHCKGTAFIGKLEIDGVQPAPFASMFELPFFYKENVTQPFKCEANFFLGSDPFPEVAKQCFCDSHGRKDITEVHAQFEFFQGMLAIQTL